MNDLILEIFVCVETHESEYPKPIILLRGDKVKLGERASEPGWHDWIWAETSLIANVAGFQYSLLIFVMITITQLYEKPILQRN